VFLIFSLCYSLFRNLTSISLWWLPVLEPELNATLAKSLFPSPAFTVIHFPFSDNGAWYPEVLPSANPLLLLMAALDVGLADKYNSSSFTFLFVLLIKTKFSATRFYVVQQRLFSYQFQPISVLILLQVFRKNKSLLKIRFQQLHCRKLFLVSAVSPLWYKNICKPSH
jgi:hypothetical protein